MASKIQYGDEAPIAALATPKGESALALIRLSGKGTVELLSKIFSRPKKILEAPGNTIVHGWIHKGGDSNTNVDEVLVSVYRAPASYTGEDGADISCHGGIAAVRAVLEALKKAGFRDALPGEFTFRAFMNGKLDLPRSESVMELVSAKTGRSGEHAVMRLSGNLEAGIKAIKESLVQVLAGIEIFLDYSEDEVDDAEGVLPNRPLAESSLEALKKLAASYQRERLYADGVLAVIAGRPNAGKSSLFNLLLKEDRSIVTDIPGTTRDWIEAVISIEGIPVRLADTAGLRSDSNTADQVERLGIERSKELLQEAGLILYLIDGEAGLTQEDKIFIENQNHNPPLIPIWNKADTPPLPTPNSSLLTPPFPILELSAKTGQGIESLTAAIAQTLETSAGHHEATDDSPGIASQRQKELIDRAVSNVTEALLLADQKMPPDLIAPLLREAINSLGEITGEISTADILEAMFSKFCVGK
jgi:tRNA modification GTPase